MPILEAVANNRLSEIEDWRVAAVVAVATGDRASFQRLSQICLLRFTSTAEGVAALAVVSGLFQQPMDDNTLAVARALLDRGDDGSIYSKLLMDSVGAVLAYREHRYPEALVLLDRFLDAPGSRLGGQLTTHPALKASSLFLRSILTAELGRTEEARRDFARAHDQLRLALGDKPRHDRGEYWYGSYQAESRQREAEAVFKAKGIPLPEPDAN